MSENAVATPAAVARTDMVAIAAGVFTVSLWGSAFVGIRAAGESLSPGSIALGRLLVSTVLLTAVWLTRREPLPARRDLVAIATYGVLWLAVYSVALNAAERSVDAGTSALLVSTGPLLIALLAGIFLREGFPPRLFVGLAIAFAGSTMIAFAAARNTNHAGFGVALLVLAVFSYSSAVVVQKSVLRRVSPFQVTWLGVLAATIASLPFGPGLIAEAPRRARRSPGSSTWVRFPRHWALRPGPSR